MPCVSCTITIIQNRQFIKNIRSLKLIESIMNMNYSHCQHSLHSYIKIRCVRATMFASKSNCGRLLRHKWVFALNRRLCNIFIERPRFCIINYNVKSKTCINQIFYNIFDQHTVFHKKSVLISNPIKCLSII